MGYSDFRGKRKICKGGKRKIGNCDGKKGKRQGGDRS
jgi:hypothetical protein